MEIFKWKEKEITKQIESSINQKKKQNTNNHHNNQKEMQEERTGPININLSCSIFHIFSFFVSSLLFHHFHVFIFQGPGIYFPEFILSKFLFFRLDSINFSVWKGRGRFPPNWQRRTADEPIDEPISPQVPDSVAKFPRKKNLLGRSGPAMTSLESHSRLISIQCN